MYNLAPAKQRPFSSLSRARETSSYFGGVSFVAIDRCIHMLAKYSSILIFLCMSPKLGTHRVSGVDLQLSRFFRPRSELWALARELWGVFEVFDSHSERYLS